MLYKNVVKSILVFFVLVKQVENKCDHIHARVSQNVLNDGFHREIKYTINLSEQKGLDVWSHGACRLTLEQILPSGAYVNADELQDMRRLNKVHACPVGDVDVEKPKHMSRPITVHMYSLVNSSRLSITLPIHLRYHRAKSKGGYEAVRIKNPWILLRCPNNVFKLCESTDTIVAPCAACSQHKCSWHNITTKSLTSPLEMVVPVGDLNDFTNVALVTFFVSFIGCFYIISVLSKISMSELKCAASVQKQKKKN
ncbi:phosphatidylinositol glycan anchor biosynthesis class X [Arctopsyche grandis]|uniref:phosphatidylinositol glycan anchor biosynthesis class X n=1 Tax=Arctopsyche grandis TaxID=121162 RepID=UPI00406D9A8E